MVSRFFFDLASIKPKSNNEAGTLIQVTAEEVPGFAHFSFINLKLKPQGLLSPIWHPNANKIGYCTQGKVSVTLRSPAAAEVFSVEKGDIFFIPQGYIHHIENVAETDSIIHFALNDSLPETMSFTQAIPSISESVFNSTFNIQSNFVNGLKNPTKDDLIKSSIPSNNSVSAINKYKFNIEKSKKAVLTKGGYVQVGTKANLPILQGLGILGFGLQPKGAVEPHWHTNAGELVFIVKGKTRITVLSPNGNVDILNVNAGQGAFAPASHFHNIENIGSDAVEVIAFFSHADPDYIGISEVAGSYPNHLLASLFNVAPEYFDQIKKQDKPLVIVPL